jgi:hypothetical protein
MNYIVIILKDGREWQCERFTFDLEKQLLLVTTKSGGVVITRIPLDTIDHIKSLE